MIHSERIPVALVDERLDRVVSIVTGCSRAVAADWIGEGRVSIDGTVVSTRARRLVEGETVTVDAPERADERPAADATVEFVVVHEDDDVIVVDKPAGLVVHPASGHPDGTLVNGLLARCPELATVGQPDRPGIVHRLDRGTSGLLVVARTDRAYEALVGDLASHRVQRVYRAVVIGHPQPGRGIVDAPIGRSARSATRMAVSASGRPARTHYEVLETYESPFEAAFVRCELETGRTHQIRVHLAAIGHPVLGDGTYGGHRGDPDPGRPFLHAVELGFVHPGTGRTVAFSSPLAPDLVEALGSFDRP